MGAKRPATTPAKQAAKQPATEPTKQPAKKPAIEAAKETGEHIGRMEPLLISQGSRHRSALTDLALDLAQKSAGFRRSLPESMVTTLADLVRSMNCYYSNLIEGHDTHPIDFERALKDDYIKDAWKRDLQFEARAHIAVQQWIDGAAQKGRAVTADSICEIHRRFCELLPDDLLWVEDPITRKRVKVSITAKARAGQAARTIRVHELPTIRDSCQASRATCPG